MKTRPNWAGAWTGWGGYPTHGIGGGAHEGRSRDCRTVGRGVALPVALTSIAAWSRGPLSPRGAVRRPHAGVTEPLPTAEGPLSVAVLIPSHRRVPVGLGRWRAEPGVSRVVVGWNGAGAPPAMPGATVRRLPWQGHGPTRSALLADVAEPYVLFTVDDAMPLAPGLVGTLVGALEEGGFDAVIPRQLPWAWTAATTAHRLAAWTPWASGPQVVAQVDHVCALYRRQTLRDHPLPAVEIGEDLAWSAGRRIGLVPAVAVLHAHPRDPAALFARERDLHAARARLGLPPTVATTGALIGALPSLLGAGLRHGPGEALAQGAELLGQWVGGRGGIAGRP